MIIDQTTLDRLLSNLVSIERLANIHGYKNMAIFKPLFFADSKKLNFVAAPASELSLSFFRFTEIESELSNLLNCETLFFPENRTDREFKKYIKQNKISLIKNNQDKITQFFADILEIKEINITDQSKPDWDNIIFNDKLGLPGISSLDKFQYPQHKHP